MRDSFITIANQKNRGYDLSLLYGVPMRWGTLTFETQHTYQKTDRTALFEDTVRDENGEFGHPKPDRLVSCSRVLSTHVTSKNQHRRSI